MGAVKGPAPRSPDTDSSWREPLSLFIHILKDIFVASAFWQLQITLLREFVCRLLCPLPGASGRERGPAEGSGVPSSLSGSTCLHDETISLEHRYSTCFVCCRSFVSDKRINPASVHHLGHNAKSQSNVISHRLLRKRQSLGIA